jgi:hypothetical protein
MHTRFLIAGTLAAGVILSVLGWFTAAILPPRFKQFKEPQAVVETIRANVTTNDIYTAPQGLFVSVSLRPDLSNRLQNFGSHLAGQFVIEFAVALGLAVVLLATSIRSPLRAGGFLGLTGLVAGTEVHFPEWNWTGFPLTHILAGMAYLAANWFVAGLVLGALRRRFDSTSAAPTEGVRSQRM